jgi:hypothetical protein
MHIRIVNDRTTQLAPQYKLLLSDFVDGLHLIVHAPERIIILYSAALAFEIREFTLDLYIKEGRSVSLHMRAPTGFDNFMHPLVHFCMPTNFL